MFMEFAHPKNMYIGPMFEVLVFVYENYWRGDACPELEQLGRKLSAAGFNVEDIQQALSWLDELNLASHKTEPTACACTR
jgi:Smg protein